MFERRGLKATAEAGGVGSGGPPARVGGQVPLSRPHPVDSSCYELAQAHKGPRAHGGEVVVISWCREETCPLGEEGLPDPLLQGGVGVVHQGPRKGQGGRRHKV